MSLMTDDVLQPLFEAGWSRAPDRDARCEMDRLFGRVNPAASFVDRFRCQLAESVAADVYFAAAPVTVEQEPNGKEVSGIHGGHQMPTAKEAALQWFA